MARKRIHAAPQNHDRWLISYADFITLLFALFVVMFATSQTDKGKAKQVSDSIRAALDNGGVHTVVREILGGAPSDEGKGSTGKLVTPKVSTTDLTPSMHYLTRELSQEIKDGKIDIHLESRGLVVSLRQAAFFPSGGDEIAPDTFGILAKIAHTIRELPNPIQLDGHTDSIPVHNQRFQSNWELSAARSIAMLQLFSGQYGLPRNRFAIAGYADTVPIDSNDTPEGRGHNRRVDLIIMNQTVLVNPEASR